MSFNLFPASAQESILTFEYFTLKSCGNDTLQYLEKNYGLPNFRYENKTLEFFINKAKNDLPFKSCWTYLGGDNTLVKFVFFTDPAEKVKEKIRKGLPIRRIHAYIWMLGPWIKIPEKLELYRKIEKFGFHKILPLDKQLYRLIKDIKMEDTYWEYDEYFGGEKIVE
jgi:hypothetical protein